MRKGILSLLCLLLLIPLASATITDFQVQVDKQPAYFEIDYSPAGTVVWYALNSSDNYGSAYWSLYGTNDDLYFVLLNQTNNYALVADTAYGMPITCSGAYTKYYLELSQGFTNPAANLNITLNATSGGGYGTVKIKSKKELFKPTLDYVVLAFCSVVLLSGGFMIMTYPKK